MVDIGLGGAPAQPFCNRWVLPPCMHEVGPAAPTLRCPCCGNSDLHFKAGGQIRCGRCLQVWRRHQLVRTSGTAGRSYDRTVMEDGEE